MKAFELENGLKVLFKGEEGLGIVSCSVFMPGGSAVEEKEGLSLLALKTGFKRSKSIPPLEFYRTQERLGTSFVPDVSFDFSSVRFQGVSEGFDEFLNLFFETVRNPDFSEESFEVEKSSLMAAIRSKKENPFLLAYEGLIRKTYKGTPYGKLPYGTESSVSELTPEEAEERFRRIVFPRGAVFSFCGKVSSIDRIVDLISRLETTPPETFSVSSRIEATEEFVIERKGASQSFLLMAFNAPSLFEKDYVAYKLLNTVIGEGVGSLLFQELREKRGLAYATGSLYPTRKFSGRLFLYIGTSPEKEKEARNSIIELVRKLPHFITEDSVKRAKEYFRGGYLLDHESRSKKAWYYGFWEVIGKGYGYEERFLEELLSIPVDGLKKVAERLSVEPYHLAVVKDG